MAPRAQAVGAYYSKADWHAQSFWAPELYAADRNTNYRNSSWQLPDAGARWKTFQAFVARQLQEIQTQYRPDIFWLDAGGPLGR